MLIPAAIVAVVLWSLAGGVSTVLGVGPLYGWAWGSFTASSSWWMKALIAVLTTGVTVGVGWLGWLGARRLWDVLNGW